MPVYGHDYFREAREKMVAHCARLEEAGHTERDDSEIILAAFANAVGKCSDITDLNDVIIYTIVNLRHICAALGIDWSAIIDLADFRFGNENAEVQ